ncbi:ABC transporter substrate-binding protein [Muricoccus radiodurans]|uniref:ABC transporter substrate-binding protein n=1 Tax=Muricoccus radiodurans TaxID=2231721 RepID=UPI003CF35551
MTGPRRTRRQALGLAAGAAVVSARAHAQSRDLTVVSWGGSYQEAQREALFRPFQLRTGARLLEETWDGGIGELRTRLGAGSGGWDVIQVEADELILGCEEGLFERLDFDAIGGRDRYIPRAVHPCGVGNVIYAFVLAYARNQAAPPRGWADFFDTARFPGRRALRRGPKVTLEVALLGDGVPAAELYATLATEAGLDRAFQRLEPLRESAIWWEIGSDPARLLSRGEAAMAIAYNGRIETANRNDGGDLGIVWTGSLTAMDSWVIARGSPNRARAVEFLRFVGDPAVQAGLPRRIPYGVTARGAEASLPADVLADLPTAPENARDSLAIDERFWVANVDRLERRFNAWVTR